MLNRPDVSETRKSLMMFIAKEGCPYLLTHDEAVDAPDTYHVDTHLLQLHIAEKLMNHMIEYPDSPLSHPYIPIIYEYSSA